MVSSPIVGQRIEVLDTDSIWSSAYVVDVLEGKIEIHYDGWDDNWNEILDVDSSRMAPIYTRTSRLKCLVSLENLSRKMKESDDRRSSLWPCVLHTRMPHGENAAELLKIEKKVFIQPYRSGLLPKHIRDKINNGGIWLEVKRINKWDILNDDYNACLCNFELAYKSCVEDTSVPGYLDDDIFMEGSCIHESYFVNEASDKNKLINVQVWESDLVDLTKLESRIEAELVCKAEKVQEDPLQSRLTNKSHKESVGLWKIYPDIDPKKATQDVAQLLPSRYRYAAKRVCEFFMFCFERQRIWYKKKSFMPRPWTEDELLHSKNFCNLFRELDSGTQYLHRHIVALLKEYKTDVIESQCNSKKRKQRESFPIGAQLIIGCDFEGKVVDIPSRKNPYYRILYVDGDEEDMTKDEVLFYMNGNEPGDVTQPEDKVEIGSIIVKQFDLEACLIRFDPVTLLYTVKIDINGLEEEVSGDDLKDMILAYDSKYEIPSKSSNVYNESVTYFSEVLFMVICFRLINRIETFEILGGIPRIKDWRVFIAKLEKLQKKGNYKIFTSAHQVIGFRRFFSTMDCLLGKGFAGLFKLERNLQVPIKNKDLEGVTKILRSIENIGPFFAWQITCDLLQSNILGDCDEHDFALFGPGAKSGLQYIFPDISDHIDICKVLVQNQSKVFELLQLDFKSFAGERQLTLKVIEHTLCEFYKYNVSLRNSLSLQQTHLRNYDYAPSIQRKYCDTCGLSLPKGDSTRVEQHTHCMMICIDCCGFSECRRSLM